MHAHKYAHTHTHSLTHTHKYKRCVRVCVRRMCTHTHIHIHTNKQTCKHLQTRARICVRAHIYTHFKARYPAILAYIHTHSYKNRTTRPRVAFSKKLKAMSTCLYGHHARQTGTSLVFLSRCLQTHHQNSNRNDKASSLFYQLHLQGLRVILEHAFPCMVLPQPSWNHHFSCCCCCCCIHKNALAYIEWSYD
jgi:hypothetical protein